MGKRSMDFEKKPRDFYGTIDPAAVENASKWFGSRTYYEPCVGAGELVNLIAEHTDLQYVGGSDISEGRDAIDLTVSDINQADLIVTNPPFSWHLLKPMLEHLPTLAPTWLLLPADIMHNKRMAPFMGNCSRIVSIGRLYWMDNKVKGVDNYCWYFFPKGGWSGDIRFEPRETKGE